MNQKEAITGMGVFLVLWILVRLGAPAWIRIIAIAAGVLRLHYLRD